MSADLVDRTPASVPGCASIDPAWGGVEGAAWAALNDDAGAWVFVVREDGVVVHANAAVRRHLGTAAGGVVGRSVSEFLPADLAQERVSCYARVAREQQPLHVEGLVDGSMVRCSLRPLGRGAPGSMAYVLCVSRRIGPDAGACPEPRHRARVDDRGALGTLSEREVEVLRLIGHGMSTAEIAKHMHRSVKTIEWHRVSLGAKLGAGNRVDLARMAIRFGLASPLEPGTPERRGTKGAALTGAAGATA
jgi:PAS domain S-box-containing protein